MSAIAPSIDMRRTLAILMAGGEGSRLNVLVHRRAKPAVSFGSIFRIIDFAMSNVMNSGLEKIGILTQYMPFSLADHVGIGEGWGMIGRTREARILPPHTGTRAADWYRGTADAVYRNLSYINRHRPASVLILSGDHVYNMNFARMVGEHLNTGADVTIAVREVPIEQAPNFGTVLTDPTGRITGFEEKPANPRSNLISMGIYVFRRSVLVEELEEIVGHQSLTDFGKHVFPQMLAQNRHLQAFRFTGYWQDVGTIRAYYDAQMDLLRPGSGIDLSEWQVRTNWSEDRPGDRPPAYFSPTARFDNSIFGNGARIGGEVHKSILSPGVVIEPGATVERSILMHDVRIAAGVRVRDAIIDKEARVDSDSIVGGVGESKPNHRYPSHLDSGLVLIGKGATIPTGSVIEKNVILFPGVTLPRGDRSHVHTGETIGDIDA
jgi:glucose-1-phosphate adenylyltransferase